MRKVRSPYPNTTVLHRLERISIMPGAIFPVLTLKLLQEEKKKNVIGRGLKITWRRKEKYYGRDVRFIQDDY